MDWLIPATFGVVYLGMVLGRLPGLALDRTGVALLGALMLVVSGRVGTQAAWDAVDVPTLALLLGLMIVSAQLRMAGFYAAVTRRLGAWEGTPQALLAWVMIAAAALSALLANDIVCLAMAPVLVEVCARRGVQPLPYLLGLACAANIGSAATLIGNPQNMLIGQALHLSFTKYLLQATPPAVLGVAAAWAIIVALQHEWTAPATAVEVAAEPYRQWPVAKGLGVLALVLAGFLFAPWPREVVALGGAALLLTSRSKHTRDFMGLVDWQLLVLFAGLFVVNHAFAQAGYLAGALGWVKGHGVDPAQPAWLFGGTLLLSNVVSNVPAVMLLLPAATYPLGGPVLALSSTLAGNLFIVGSIANIIVVDQAARLGVKISWHKHAAVGVPITLATLALAAAWLALLTYAGWV